MVPVDIRRGKERAHTKLGWLDSWHSFSFGTHHDPANTHHGLLLVSNDDRVSAGAGFGTHFHQDMEIVTWVLAGRLVHEDSEGNHGELYPGLAQRMSAGTGIEHSERNPSSEEDVHFVQMWVQPDTMGIAPSYEQRDLSGALSTGGLHAIASGRGDDGAVAIHQRDAVLSGARVASGEAIAVPAGAHVHVFIAVGEADLEGIGVLFEGDAARLTDAGSLSLTARRDQTEILIWVTS